MKSLLVKISNKFNAQGGFVKAVSILVGGTAISQLISIIILPFITRLYSPIEFSVFSVYISILSIISVASCLRFEIAIPIPTKDEDALSLLILALISNFITTLCVVIIIFIFDDVIVKILNQPNFSSYLWLIPIGVFFSGLYNGLQYWATRKKQFTVLAKTRIFQAVGGAGTQVGLGLLKYGVTGLIVGQIVNYSSGILRLILNLIQDIKCLNKKITLKRIGSNLKKYENFPKYSTLEVLANTGGIQLPIVIIAALSLGAEAGYLMLAMQVLGIPMKFIGGAISQVYLSHAPKAFEQGNIREYTIEVLNKLFKFSFGVLIFIGIISPVIVEYIFGSQWKNVGIVISWMIPWFVLQLISSPISMVMHIANKQKMMLILTLFGFFLKIIVIYTQYYINSKYLLQAYAISSAIFYLVCYLVFSKIALLKLKDHIELIRKTIFPSFCMLILAIVIVFGFKWSGL